MYCLVRYKTILVEYQGDVCLGSGRILRAGPSLYTLNAANCRTLIQARRRQEAAAVTPRPE
jgi:hypothetical protein